MLKGYTWIPKYLSVVPASWNKDFQLALNCVWVIISGGLPITSQSEKMQEMRLT